MNPDSLSSIITVIVTLSIASERLVEILKGMIPGVAEKRTDPQSEARRAACVQILAVICGLVTAWLSQNVIKNAKLFTDPVPWIALGLLASGGSAFWNSVLDYLVGVKEIKNAKAFQERVVAQREGSKTAHLRPGPGVPPKKVA